MPEDYQDLDVYAESMALGDLVWAFATRWPYFERDTIGKQLVRAADSIAANIAESSGRFHLGDRRRFIYYARASAREARCWIEKASSRNLIDAATAVDCTDRVIRIEQMLSRMATSGMWTRQSRDT